jgi:hypothetical protein
VFERGAYLSHASTFEREFRTQCWMFGPLPFDTHGMANFAERIAYWYLRLNGFFMVENFVHHENEERHGADADILAMRLPGARERIDDREVTCDNWEQRFGFELERHPIAVIVQVKGGGGDVSAAFRPDRLRDAARRFGGFDDAQVEEIAMSEQQSLLVNHWRVTKLVIGTAAYRTAHFISLSDAWRFVRDRFREFHDRKRGDWDHFPDALVQFLAWRISEGAADV